MKGADRRMAGLWLALLAFFVYGSWVPMALAPRELGPAWQAFLSLPPPALAGASRTDVAVNFLLTLPIAFGAAYLVATLPSRALRWTLYPLLWPALLLLSLGVEFGQMFFPPRTPSLTDVAAQVAGSTLGLVAFALLRQPAQALVAELSARMPVARRLERALFIYGLLLLAWQLMPLDLTLSPVEVYRKWRDGRVLLLPFAALPEGRWALVYELGTDVLQWAPVGALWWLSTWRPGLSGLLWRGLLVTAAVEFAQLFVLSRVTDVTDVLMGTLGVVLGAALARAAWRRGGLQAEGMPRLLVAALLLWAAVAVSVAWLPFNFDLARLGSEPAQWFGWMLRMPFLSYFNRSEFGALGEVLRKLLVFLPGGLLLALRFGGQEHRARQLWLPLGLLALVLELGQLALPGKTAELTDAALGALGAWLGWRLGLGLRAQAVAPADTAGPSTLSSASAWPSGADGRRRRRRSHARPLRVQGPGPGLALPGVLVLAVLVWLAARLPGVPYNLARLVPAGPEGAAAALGVALALAWIVMAPTLLLPEARRPWRPALPLLLLAHALASFAVLRLAVPLEMLHKIVGTPVLGWGWLSWLEDLGRYAALHLALMLPLVGAMWLVRTATAPRALPDLLWWAGWSLLLLLPLHAVVVWGAATDNLVELMADGGSLGASLALAAGVGLAATAGTALAATWGGSGRGRGAWRRGPLAVLAVLALLVAPAAWALGLEDALFKYDRSFSAAQFLLSAGRDAYATGGELLARAAAALAVGVALVALLQAAAWRALARATLGRA